MLERMLSAVPSALVVAGRAVAFRELVKRIDYWRKEFYYYYCYYYYYYVPSKKVYLQSKKHLAKINYNSSGCPTFKQQEYTYISNTRKAVAGGRENLTAKICKKNDVKIY